MKMKFFKTNKLQQKKKKKNLIQKVWTKNFKKSSSSKSKKHERIKITKTSYPLAGVSFESLRAIFSIFDSRASLLMTVWILLSFKIIGFAMTRGLFSKVSLSFFALPTAIRQKREN